MADSATTFKDSQLTDRTPQPKGVLQKNLKTMLYMGAVGLLILATFISSRKKMPTAGQWENSGLKIQNRCTHIQRFSGMWASRQLCCEAHPALILAGNPT
jgi:hypothetical protein